jgi:hypothetical protein
MKPDFKNMPRTELKSYVLAHRDDDEAVRVLMARRSPDSEATWYDFPDTEAGLIEMEKVLRSRIESLEAN